MRIQCFLAAGLLLVFFGVNGAAQEKPKPDLQPDPPYGSDLRSWTDLTEAQIGKMRTIRMETDKILLPLEKSVQTREAELDELMIAEKPDLKRIEAKIDEIEALRGEIRKKRVAARLETRSLLTDAQRLRWDSFRARGFGARSFGRGRFGGRDFYRGFPDRRRFGPDGYGMRLNRRDRFRDFRGRRFLWRDTLPEREDTPEMEAF